MAFNNKIDLIASQKCVFTNYKSIAFTANVADNKLIYCDYLQQFSLNLSWFDSDFNYRKQILPWS